KRLRISRPSRPTLHPNNVAEPEVIGCSWSKHFKNVLLPAPLGPSSPIAPGATCRLTPSNARCSPKSLDKASVSMTSGGNISIYRFSARTAYGTVFVAGSLHGPSFAAPIARTRTHIFAPLVKPAMCAEDLGELCLKVQ